MTQDPIVHLKEIDGWDFEKFDYWKSETEIWSYLEIPSSLRDILIFMGQRRCLDSLYLRLIDILQIPSLQCQVLLYYPEEHLIALFDRFLQTSNTKSAFWSFLTILTFRLKIKGELESNKNEWIAEIAHDSIDSICSLCIRHNKTKELLEWLFSHKHREWSQYGENRNIEKDLLLLIEANVVYNWNDSFYDKDNHDIDYLTYLSLDVDDKHPLSDLIFRGILNGFHESIQDKFTSQPLEWKEYEIIRCIGFGEAFYKVYHSDLLNKVKEELKNYRCNFESWSGKTKKHDYRHVTQYCFILGGIISIIINNKIDNNLRLDLFDIVRDEILISYHVCSQSYTKYFCLPLTIVRVSIHILDEIKLNDFDFKLIEQIDEIENLLTVFTQSSNEKLSDTNKILLKDRWDKEYPSLEANYLSTNRERELEVIKSQFEFILNN